MHGQSFRVADTPRAAREIVDLAPDEFRALGHDLIDRIADFLARLPSLPVAPGESARDPTVWAVLERREHAGGGGSGALGRRSPYFFRQMMWKPRLVSTT